MLHVTFSEEELDELRYERFHHPHPRVQQRMEALLLKSQGLQHKDICQFVGISLNTLRNYLRIYEQDGLDGLKVLKYRGPVSELDAHRGDLEDDLLEHPPATIAEARARIKALTGIERCPTQVGLFLKRLGLRRLKVGCLPAKADVEIQEEFKKK